MNLLKFLAVDRSLSAGRDVVGRFQMRDECLLPKFPAATEEPLTRSNQAQLEPRWRRWLHRITGRHAVVPRCAVAPDAAVVEKPMVASPVVAMVPAAPEGRGDANSGVNPSKRMAQSEFRFDHVRVVCNDLHDADFELVSPPIGQRTSRRAAPVRELAPA